ncbi:hypothetical protein L7F22_001710 [Adiantum nelumboides]|nr:hypothetical protein [Adiantum nelumboides]
MDTGDNVDALDSYPYVFDVNLDYDYDDGDAYSKGVQDDDQYICATGEKVFEWECESATKYLMPRHETCDDISCDHDIDKPDGSSEEEDMEFMDLLDDELEELSFL